MTKLLPCLLAALIASTSAFGQSASPGPASTVQSVKIPTSWFNKAKGYEKALELQKQTGADIFVYFSRQAPENEKGLCSWFETKGLNTSKVKDYLRDYIKVSVPLPSNPDCQKMAQDFEVRKCPAIFIVQPSGLQNYCKVFDWPGGRPELYKPEELIEFFRARSSDRYQRPAGESDEKSQSPTP